LHLKITTLELWTHLSSLSLLVRCEERKNKLYHFLLVSLDQQQCGRFHSFLSVISITKPEEAALLYFRSVKQDFFLSDGTWFG